VDCHATSFLASSRIGSALSATAQNKALLNGTYALEMDVPTCSRASRPPCRPALAALVIPRTSRHPSTRRPYRPAHQAATQAAPHRPRCHDWPWAELMRLTLGLPATPALAAHRGGPP